MRAKLNKPPKGYNSFDGYGWSVTEEEFKNSVDFCDKHLKPFGYNIMTVDFCWSHPGADTRPNPDIGDTGNVLCMDEYGRLIPDTGRFPYAADGAGFKNLADFVHGRAMKFGIHLMRGIPKQAVEADTPVKGTEYTAKDIADVNGHHCWWLDHMHPLNMEHPGAQAYLDSLFELYAEWGVDFVKIDDLVQFYDPEKPYCREHIEGYSKAIEKCGREMIFSLSPGATPPEEWEHVAKYANMWRISPDFWDNYETLKRSFDLFDTWSKRRVDNTYPDGDMLPFGKLSLRGPMGEPRYSSFTYDEKMSLMAMWCINGSPLILGGEPSCMDQKTIDLLTNRLLLQMDNSAMDAGKIYCEDELLIWTAEDRYNEDVLYIAVFNLSDELVQTPEIDLSLYEASSWCGMNDDHFTNAHKIHPVIYPHGAFVCAVK